MQALGSRRGLVITLVALGLAVLAAGALAAYLWLERPAVATPFPEPGSAVASAAPMIGFDAPSGDVDSVRVSVDGVDLSDRLVGADGRLMVPAAGLADGMHTVDVRVEGGNPFARSVGRSWEFEVSTSPPALAVTAPEREAAIGARRVPFRGTAEPGATVEVAYEGGSVQATAGPRGRWKAIAHLPEGDVAATITALDRAGNATQAERSVMVDVTPPTLNVSHPGEGRPLTETDEPLIYGTVAQEDLAHVTFTVSVGGREVQSVRGSAGVALDAAQAGLVEAGATGASPLQLDGDRFALAVGTLPQGRNELTVSVRDAVGNVARKKMVVLVDSSEQFGTAQMVRGARGADVAELQERLKEAGSYSGAIDSRFGESTEAALERYQRRFRLDATGRFDPATQRAMIGRIVVHTTQRKLRLIRNGEVARTYRVAVGTAAHPTPLGDFQIVNLQVDPTWSPPESPWAEGLGPIPPGPGNPLGTRWIGTSSPAIGIHGTYADSSIGTAASHGCIRMHIPEVEELYEEVAVGMKVSFVA